MVETYWKLYSVAKLSQNPSIGLFSKSETNRWCVTLPTSLFQGSKKWWKNRKNTSQEKQSTKPIRNLNARYEHLRRTHFSLLTGLFKLSSPFAFFKRTLNYLVNVFGTNCHPSFLLFSPTQTAPINSDIHYKNHPTTFQLCALKYNVFSPLFSLAYVPSFFFFY